MSDYEVSVAGDRMPLPAGWELEWIDLHRRIARVTNGQAVFTCLVEGAGTDWVITIRGRRIPVTVRTRREVALAGALARGDTAHESVDVKSPLPGLVVGVSATEGAEVAEGQPLITIDAMKMQNEVRAPRTGRVAIVSVKAGETVRSGQLLLRIE